MRCSARLRRPSQQPPRPLTQGQKWSKTSMQRSVTEQCLARSGRTRRHETQSWCQWPAHSAGESSALRCALPSRWLCSPPDEELTDLADVSGSSSSRLLLPLS